MTDAEWQVLDNAYMMCDYETIRAGASFSPGELDVTLVRLMQRGWLRQLVYNNARRDYEDVDPFDVTKLRDAHYVISKSGLIAHTGI